MQPELLLDAGATLGESPAWDGSRQSLYWVDILKKQLHIFTGSDRTIQLEDSIGCVAPCKDGRLILCLSNGFWTIDLNSEKLIEVAAPPGEPPNNRFNDGKCDPAGRMLAGTMDLAEKEANGSLYSLSPAGKITKLLGEVRISNGLAWSPDYKILYFIDTPRREVTAFDYELETGRIAKPRVAIRVPEELGWPDGMTSDQQGNLWIAMWGGAQVTNWDPLAGKLLQQISVPAANVSSCAFGGKDLNELYITSARKGLDKAALARYPLTGGLFRVRTKVEGLPTFEFGS